MLLGAPALHMVVSTPRATEDEAVYLRRWPWLAFGGQDRLVHHVLPHLARNHTYHPLYASRMITAMSTAVLRHRAQRRMVPGMSITYSCMRASLRFAPGLVFDSSIKKDTPSLSLRASAFVLRQRSMLDCMGRLTYSPSYPVRGRRPVHRSASLRPWASYPVPPRMYRWRQPSHALPAA